MFYWSWSVKNNNTMKSDRKINSNIIKESLNINMIEHKDDSSSILGSIPTTNTDISINKREEMDEKISSRQLIPQCGTNPYQQFSYANNITTCDNYLKPISTSIDKVKQSNDS